MKRIKQSRFDIINTILVLLITFIILYPLYFVLIASVSSPKDVAMGRTLLWFKNVDLAGYTFVFKYKQIWTGYRNSIIYTVFGTLFNLLTTIPAAYVLSKKWLPGRQVMTWYFFITMYISGGLIPSYLLVKSLGFLDTPWIMILGSGVSAYNLIIARQYFQSSIPGEIYESAEIDGATEWASFVRIAIPLAKPIIAVLALYYAVGHWNSYYNAMIYLRNQDLYPLQLVLRNILIIGQQLSTPDLTSAGTSAIEYMSKMAEMVDNIKYVVILVSSLPMLVAYPFVQKYFTKGIMIGSVKG